MALSPLPKAYQSTLRVATITMASAAWALTRGLTVKRSNGALLARAPSDGFRKYVDLGRAVRRAVDAGVAVKGGGHAMAAGVTLPPGGVAAFSAFLDTALADCLGGGAEAMDIDAAMTAGGAQPELVAMIEAHDTAA